MWLGRASLAMGSFAPGPGVLGARGGSVACSHNQFPPFPLPGSSQCRSEVGRRGSGAGGGTTGGHVASAAGFHPEMPSGTLALGDTTKPQEIHREGGVGFPGNLCFTPASDPLAELHGPQVLQALLLDNIGLGFMYGDNINPSEGQGGDKSRGTCAAAAWGGGCQSPAGPPDLTCMGRAGCSIP